MGYMEQALSLAKLALGEVSPSPAVGAVIVRGDVVVGQGYTQPPGSHHAEIVALYQAGEQARGSTMFVTLEPCCHYGRTPPCTQAIIAAGIGEVHMAILDPNPLVSGKGMSELKKAGINTCLGECEDKVRQFNEAYIKFIITGKPFVTAKFAMSLDGKIATKSGDSRWVSGSDARKYVHHLRYSSDAIMVGVNTIFSDDPRLTCRCGGGKGGMARKQPLRVVVDSWGRTAVTARLFSEPGKILLAVGHFLAPKEQKAFNRVGAEILELPSSDGLVDLEKLLQALGTHDVTNVLVEGGSILLGSMFDRGLVDKVIIFIAPIIIGGEGAKVAVGGKGVDKVVDSVRLKRTSIERFGEDLMISGYVRG
ncbi:bifunctional diaminohydroxyphosphoribosylaminopyrimidine deaminase/5-amino-6-(5-phosphoribosylamino)uracil reductase RibD [Chloroflexota bacterium]